MSLQSKLKQVGEALHAALGDIVHHYYRPDGAAQSVTWQESGEDNSLHTGNKRQSRPSEALWTITQRPSLTAMQM